MSGITPILDTLLHHVLGRRGVARSRPLLERPIAPARSGQASSPAHSDSRLDPGPRPSGAGNPDVGAADLDADLAAAMRRARAQADPAARAAVIARLSMSARDIADILARHPAPGAAIEPSAPLLSADNARDASLLARVLRASIETSGLFYEAHLLRWYQGRYPLHRLLREPQMRGHVAGGAASSAASVDKGDGLARQAHSTQGRDVAAAQTGVKPGASVAAAAPSLTYSADGRPSPAPQAVMAAATDLSIAYAPGTEGDTRHVVSHDLEGVLRRQLDLLSSPALSWQGRPWAGLFMALLLQPPPHRPDAGVDADAHQESGAQDDEHAWSSRLQLRLARLGEVTVGVRLNGARVALRIEAEPVALARFRSERDTLVGRLNARGFEDVVVDMGQHPRASEGDDA
ncbi:MAG TPA: flagellar hook-length control protein FliK [Oleiagrimonas sp.]|nr:flagellar hook-length control protein FliK [Oleiagrimonas sp.]